MRRLALTHRDVIGAPLARDVVGRSGDVLARSGHLVSDRVAGALQQRGVTSVYVDDAASAGIQLAPMVPDPVMVTFRGLLDDLFTRVLGAVGPLANQPSSRIVETLHGNGGAFWGNRVVAALSELRAEVTSLARVCAVASGDSGYLTDRAPDDDLVGHSIHVAALTARIGASVGFAGDDLAGVTFAALLHDAGLIFVPAELRLSPADWNVPQRMRYEDHTVLGEALLQSFSHKYPEVSVVAGEHHEAQDGSGFPRGRQGYNRVLRGADQLHAADRVALVSEVVAVADRYERLVSPAPARAGLSPAEARNVLSGEAGSRLNAEVVARFLELFPALPIGTEVRIVGGEHDGSHALIVRPASPARPKPLVRVYADRSRSARTPIDLDLAGLSDVNVRLDAGRAA